jgi:hypothetical protein
MPPHTYTHVIANTLTKKMREYIHDYYVVSFDYGMKKKGSYELSSLAKLGSIGM